MPAIDALERPAAVLRGRRLEYFTVVWNTLEGLIAVVAGIVAGISDAAMRPVVIVFLDPTSDRSSRFFQAAIFRGPDFLFLQATMEPFDVAVAFLVMIRRAAMRDAQPVQSFDEPGRGELGAIIGGQS